MSNEMDFMLEDLRHEANKFDLITSGLDNEYRATGELTDDQIYALVTAWHRVKKELDAL